MLIVKKEGNILVASSNQLKAGCINTPCFQENYWDSRATKTQFSYVNGVFYNLLIVQLRLD